MIKTLIKTFKIIYNMFTDDKLATAQIAQLFGSELLKVQMNATTDSGSRPEIVKLDPKQFLTADPRDRSNRKAEEQRIIQALQREAEAACPLPANEQKSQPPVLHQEPVMQVATKFPPPPLSIPLNDKLPISASSLDILEKINYNLERIANKIETVDITIKKKRVKRLSK
jgi:hypothetical protein